MCKGEERGAEAPGHTFAGRFSSFLGSGGVSAPTQGAATKGAFSHLPWRWHFEGSFQEVCGEPRSSPGLSPTLTREPAAKCSVFPLKKQTNKNSNINNTPEAKQTFFLPAVMNSDTCSQVSCCTNVPGLYSPRVRKSMQVERTGSKGKGQKVERALSDLLLCAMHCRAIWHSLLG